MATLNIQLPKFGKDDDWQMYSEQLENYFIINELTDEKKVSVLLTLLSPNVYKVLRESCEPSLPKDRTYEQLNALLRIHFAKNEPKASWNVFEERRKFYKMVQGNKETTQQWMDRLKKMSTSCSFDANVEDILRDKFVTGLRDESVFKKLSNGDGSMDLNTAYQMAISREGFYEKKQFTDHSEKEKFVFGNKLCRHCGESKHDFKVCRDKGYSCDKCGKNGHLAKACYLNQEKKSLSTSVHDLSRSPKTMSLDDKEQSNLNKNFSTSVHDLPKLPKNEKSKNKNKKFSTSVNDLSKCNKMSSDNTDKSKLYVRKKMNV